MPRLERPGVDTPEEGPPALLEDAANAALVLVAFVAVGLGASGAGATFSPGPPAGWPGSGRTAPSLLAQGGPGAGPARRAAPGTVEVGRGPGQDPARHASADAPGGAAEGSPHRDGPGGGGEVGRVVATGQLPDGLTGAARGGG